MQSYLLSDDELFARAYAQWVTTKTGAPKLVNTLDFHRGQQNVLKSVQWQDDEFAQYIAPALDEFLASCNIIAMLFTDVPIDSPWDVIVQSYMDAMGWPRERAEEYVDVLAGIRMWKPCDREEKYKNATPPPLSCPLW